MTAHTVKPIPDDYPVVTPILQVEGAAKALEFYATVFDARERVRYPGPGGTVLFAEVALGERGLLMVRDASPEHGIASPQSLGGTPVTVAVYVADVDATIEKALTAGAELIRAAADEPDGERVGSFRDPFGHVWSVASRVEELTYEVKVARVTEKYLS